MSKKLFAMAAGVPFTNKFSVLLDGVDKHIDWGSIASFERTDTFSLNIWFKTSSAGSQAFLGKRDVSAERGWVFFIFAGNIFFILENFGSGGDRIFVQTTGVNYADGAWRNATLTYSGSSTAAGVKIYVNGSNLSLTTITDGLTATTITAVTCQVGSEDTTSDLFNGNLDEPSIYDKELSAAEVTEIYNGGVPIDLNKLDSATDLHAWLPFFQSDIDGFPTMADNSGNGRDGTASVNMEDSDIVEDTP